MAIVELKTKIKQLKEDLLKEILESTTLSKIEKLSEISYMDLYGTTSWYEHVFEKYKAEYTEIIMKNPEWDNSYKHQPMIDDYFVINDYQRHASVDFGSLLTEMSECIDYDKKQKDYKDSIKVMTNRNTKDKFYLTFEQFVDCIYEWCITNKSIGFTIDW